jgi:hypothetical protein
MFAGVNSRSSCGWSDGAVCSKKDLLPSAVE